jgi:hypothetical protein
VEDAVVRGEMIRLKVADQGHSFTSAVEVRDPRILASVAQALSSARGKTLKEAGEVII